MNPADAYPGAGFGPLSGQSRSAPLPGAYVAARAATAVKHVPERAANSPINFWLIGLAMVYLAFSYFLLAPSIWVRLALASLLILRMRADIVIPLCLSCLQLKLNIREIAEDMGRVAPAAVEGLTGFESYAFAVPPLLISLRTALALPSARTDKRGFPFWLYFLWLFGGVFVVVGAFVNMGSARGWTGGMRMYSIVGCLFYGLLMPRPSLRQIDRLAGGLATVGLILFAASAVRLFNSKVLFVLAPLCVSWGVLGVLSLSGTRTLKAAVVLAVTSLPIMISSTFTVLGAWLWAGIASVFQFTTRPGGRWPPSRMIWLVAASAAVLATIFLVGLTRRVGEKSRHDGSLLGRIEWKLYSDRAPLWWGCLQIIAEEPSLIPTPERPFVIEWFGEEQLWPAGPHNLALELVNQLGIIAGPISILVLGYFVCRCAVVLTQEPSRGVQALAIATISGILVGGLTLPYMVQDRIAEYLMIATGVALSSSVAARSEPNVATRLGRRA